MKKFLRTFTFVIFAIGAQAQTTATDFTANDCTGASHNLFSELNSGKVVLLAWVMPCAQCTAACQMAWNIASSYSLSNPGQVVFYIADDFGTTSCVTLNNWTTTYSLTETAKFTNSVISMSNYGSNGMPKLVVLAGASTHSVYYNQNSIAINQNAVQAAVSLALNDVVATKINENSAGSFALKLSPNPASTVLRLNCESKNSADLSVEIYNSLGQSIRSMSASTELGKNESSIDVSELSNGLYFIKASDGKSTDIIKIIITH